MSILLFRLVGKKYSFRLLKNFFYQKLGRIGLELCSDSESGSSNRILTQNKIFFHKKKNLKLLKSSIAPLENQMYRISSDYL